MKKKKANPFIISIVICLIALIAVVILLIVMGPGKQKKRDISIETTESAPMPKKELFNFVIFGIDDVGYTPADIYRSDMVMVVSIDSQEHRINLISILRDSLVPIEGTDPQKLNYAYKFGGVSLALKTINDAFHTDFQKYLTLNWQDLVFLVDDIGGIDIELTEEEAELLNTMVALDISREERNLYSEDVWGGLVHLDGTQATHFSRIRKIDTDYWRAWRQHRTLHAIQKKVQTMSPEDFQFLAQELISNTYETNLTVEDVMSWLSKGVVNYEIVSNVIPDPDYETDVVGGIDDSTGNWVWAFDLDKGAERLHSIMGD